MRDLLFKNITSADRKRKIIFSSEIVDNGGMRSTIQRHFICAVKEIKENEGERPIPCLYVLKKRDTRAITEQFYCKIKGSLYTVSHGRVFLILFMHSLKINLSGQSIDDLTDK